MALNKQQQEILDELGRVTNAFDKSINRLMPDIKREVYEMIISKIEKFKLSNKGENFSVSKQVDNLKLLQEIKQGMKQIYEDSGYNALIKDFNKSYRKTVPIIDKYFNTLVKEYKGNKELYDSLRKLAIDKSNEQLLRGGLDANITKQVEEILSQNITSGGRLVDTRRQLRDFIVGNKDEIGQYERYVKQITNDSVQQYNQQYINTVSDDLNLEWYYYKGTTIKDTRYFCCLRENNYYRRKDVISWADLEWAGKNKNTTKSNIVVMRGGYNCRHIMIPVNASVVPDRFKESKEPVYDSGCEGRKKKIRINGRKQWEKAK